MTEVLKRLDPNNFYNSEGKIYCIPGADGYSNIGEYGESYYNDYRGHYSTYHIRFHDMTRKIINAVIENPALINQIAETEYTNVVKFCLNLFVKYVSPHEIIKMDFLSIDDEIKTNELNYIIGICSRIYSSFKSRGMIDSFRALINKIYDMRLRKNFDSYRYLYMEINGKLHNFRYLYVNFVEDQDLYNCFRYLIMSPCLETNNFMIWTKDEIINILRAAELYNDEVMLTTLADRGISDSLRTDHCWYRPFIILKTIKENTRSDWLKEYIKNKS